MTNTTLGTIYVTMEQKEKIDSMKSHSRVPTYTVISELLEKAKLWDDREAGLIDDGK